MTCVCLLPDVLVDSGTADDVMCEIAAQVETLRVSHPDIDEVGRLTRSRPATPLRSAGPRPEWAVNRFGVLRSAAFTPAAGSPGPTRRATTTLVERMATLTGRPSITSDQLAGVMAAEELRGKVLIVRAWEEHDPEGVGAMAVRFTAMAKESRVPAAERVRLLVLTRDKDITEGSLERLEPVTSRVHWWWGVVGRLDTTVVVAAARPTGRRGHPSDLRSQLVDDYLFNDVVSEIAGPDLALATHLTSSWNGMTSSLQGLMEEYVNTAKRDVVMLPPEWHGRPGRPPGHLRRAWNHGLADLWDGEVRVSPTAQDRASLANQLDQHLWRAQNRALTPVIDQLRMALENKVRSTVDSSVITSLLDGETETGSDRPAAQRVTRPILEIGRMAWAAKNGVLRMNYAETKLLYCLRDVRNSLAHLAALDDSTVSRLAQAIANSSVRNL